MADAVTILSSIASSGVISGGLIWYTKSWISARLENAIRHEYEQKLETHKAQLRCETDKEISRLNAELQIAAVERNVRYSRIFEKRVESISKVHNKLLAFKDSVNDYATSAEASRADKFQAMQSRAQEFKGCLDANLLFIPETTADKFAPLYNLLFEKALRFSATGFNWSPADAGNDSELFTNLLKLLEHDCRGIFGDYDHISKGRWQETAVRVEAPQDGMNKPN